VSDERLTVPLLVARHATRDPDLQFVVTHERALTYAELDRASARLAAKLVADGVAKRTRVGLLMPNGVDWAVTAIAAMRIGAVVVPLSTLLRPPELEAQLRTAEVEHLLCVRSFRGRDYTDDLSSIGLEVGAAGADALRVPSVPSLRAVRVGDGWMPGGTDGLADPASTAVARAFEASVRPADDMVVIFTSGSRGAPKGVIHTHGGALGATASGLHIRCIDRGDRLYIPMPFFWMGGFGGGLITVLVAGATLITEAEPSPETTLALLARERVTLFRGWPDQAAALAAHPSFHQSDLPGLKPGSLDAVLPPALRAAPGTRPILFGMTESFGPYCADRLDRDLPPAKRGSLGRPFAGVEVDIRDPDTHAPLPRGVPGEIHLRGPNIMRGICGREQSDVFSADGAYPTGDLGRLDEDGYLYFSGRLDDMFKVRGATVYPSEVESALEAIPFVRRAFVVDVGDEHTRAVGAAVVLTRGDAAGSAEVEREARQRLSAFKVPSRWVLVDDDDIPRTGTGKVDKEGLRRLLARPDPPT
jgi:acyl-CoA synthetase (AMP-forming)/AMP-acid ligase II